MKTIIVCGGGALGSHLLWLGRGLEVNWIVIDDDRVETRNLASQWFVKQMLGKHKAQALKAQMQNFAGCKIESHAVRLRANNVETLFARADLVVDCFDNAASRKLVQNFVREKGIPCLHGGLAADGTFGAVRWDTRFVIDSENVPGQATTPPCEAGKFLPLIVRVSACLVEALQKWLAEDSERNWNVSLTASDSF